MTVADDIAAEIRRWNVRAVEPTYVVMSLDVAETLARSYPESAVYGRDAWRIWGLPIVIASLPVGTWAVATDRPVDAKKMVAVPA